MKCQTDKYLIMCTIVAKKFPGVGWVGMKNRDRSLPTETELLRKAIGDMQCVTIVDEQTRWTEGMNSNGISIISSSLEPVIEDFPSRKKHRSKNGALIRDALEQSTVSRALDVLRDNITGCVMVFDQEQLWLIEGHHDGNDQIIRRITIDSIARTNHGIWIPSAGYQRDSENLILRMRRLSSESRLSIANHVLNLAREPKDLMPLMANTWIDNPQLNTMRHAIDLIPTRTTEQLMLEPGKKLLLIRNTSGTLEFNQENANPPGSNVLVGIVQS
jgi:hypothetical protein